MSQYKHFARQFGIVGILQVVIKLRAIILLPLITKVLGTLQYALWAQFTVTVEFAFPLISMGLNGAMLRFLPSEKENSRLRDGLFSILFFVFGLGLCIGVSFFIFSHQLANLFFDGDETIVNILSGTVIANALSIFLLTYFRTFKQTMTYSIFFLSENVGGLLLVIILALQGFGIHTILIWLLLLKCVQILALLAVIIKQIGFALPQFQRIKEYLRYSFPSVPSNVSGWAVRLSDRYIIAYFLGITAVAYYAPAYTLGGVIAVLIEPFSLIMTPYLAQNYDEDKKENVQTFLKYSIKYYLAVAIPAAVGLSILSKPLLTMLSNEEIASQAYFVTPFVALSTLLYGLTVLQGEIIFLSKKTGIIAYVWIISAVLNVLLNILLIPIIGIVAAAATTLVSYALVFVILYLRSRRYLSVPFDLVVLGKIILNSAVMGLVVFYVIQNYPSHLLVAILIGFFIYLAFSFMTKILSREEIRFFRYFLKKNTHQSL